MNAIAIKNELAEYVSLLNDAEQESVLNMLKTFIKARNNELGSVTIEQYNKELEEADAEIEAGEFVTHDDVKKLLL